MPNAEKIVNRYLRAASEHWPRERSRENLRENLRAAQELERILDEAANAAAHVFNVTTGDNAPALLTVSRSGEATLYRLREDLILESLSYGRLTGGLLSEVASLLDDDESDAGLRKVTYSNPGLEAIGGQFTVDDSFGLYGEASAIRDVFLPMTGRPAD